MWGINELVRLKHLVWYLAYEKFQVCALVHRIFTPSREVRNFVPFYADAGAEVQGG